jgi:RNA polymerase sigma factor (sigma-70 family)
MKTTWRSSRNCSVAAAGDYGWAALRPYLRISVSGRATIPGPRAFMMQMMIVVPIDGQDDVALERDAFGDFFGEHYGQLGRAMFLLTGNASEAEEIAEDAMVRVYEQWHRVGTMDSPDGYLYRTALNLYRSRLRRAATVLRRRPPAEPTDQIEAAEERNDIGRLLRSLPEGQREALVLVEWLGLSADEAASVLHVKPGSVRARVSRAKSALRADGLPEEHER